MSDEAKPDLPAADPASTQDAAARQRERDVAHLVESASGWMGEALDAWSDDDYAKVSLLAPLAVEHLGKAVLWQVNPVLVVPLSPDAEASLVKLATTPGLTDPKLRTVGLKRDCCRIR
ncbi:hypothetical protein JK358_38775 [Nocardia sp. 2]|uniref:Uncharacterized protein n=1 Tax=Nocardia acididurans TaxID=2802282 RepID=A0ABS1MJY3_9NOCA|nr:hypothetical protein [Nocardia acididurans]MBL1080355.1 hypothetical protein [Nocardia acididurans]